MLMLDLLRALFGRRPPRVGPDTVDERARLLVAAARRRNLRARLSWHLERARNQHASADTERTAAR